MRRPIVPAAVLLVAGLCAVGALRPLPGALFPFVWAGALWLPGLLLLTPRRIRGLFGAGADRGAWWLPPAAGPVLFGALFSLSRLGGLPVSAASLVPIAAGAVWAALCFLPRGPLAADDPVPSGDERLDRRAFWLLLAVGAAVFALTAWPPLVNDALRLRDDARLHLPVIQRILAGSFPPENPFLAGEPLGYFWFYHAVAAGAAALVRLPLDLVASGLNLHALIVLLAALDAVARRFGLTPAARAATLLLFALGLSPAGWMRLVYLRLTAPDLDWALLATKGSVALFPLLSPGDPRVAASLTKIAISNPFPLALGLFLLAASRPRPRSAGEILELLVLTGGTLLFHMVAGAVLVGGLLLREAALALLPTADSRALRLSILRAAVPVVLAVALVSPYLVQVLSARASGAATEIAFRPGRGLGIQLALVGLWLLALPALRAWLRRPGGAGYLLLAVPPLLMTFLARMEDGNEYKGAFLLLALLAPVAGAGLARLSRGSPLILALLLLPFLPGPLLAARAYSRDATPGDLPRPDAHAVERAAQKLPEGAVAWKIEPGTGYSTYTYHADRTFYVSDPYALLATGQWSGPTARRRVAQLASARSGGLERALAEAAGEVAPRPLVVLVSAADRSAHRDLVPRLARLGCRPVFELPVLSAYELPAPKPRGGSQ